MTKYHISPDGKHRQCNPKVTGVCGYGEGTPHGDTPEEAYQRDAEFHGTLHEKGLQKIKLPSLDHMVTGMNDEMAYKLSSDAFKAYENGQISLAAAREYEIYAFKQEKEWFNDRYGLSPDNVHFDFNNAVKSALDSGMTEEDALEEADGLRENFKAQGRFETAKAGDTDAPIRTIPIGSQVMYKGREHYVVDPLMESDYNGEMRPVARIYHPASQEYYTMLSNEATFDVVEVGDGERASNHETIYAEENAKAAKINAAQAEHENLLQWRRGRKISVDEQNRLNKTASNMALNLNEKSQTWRNFHGQPTRTLETVNGRKLGMIRRDEDGMYVTRTLDPNGKQISIGSYDNEAEAVITLVKNNADMKEYSRNKREAAEIANSIKKAEWSYGVDPAREIVTESGKRLGTIGFDEDDKTYYTYVFGGPGKGVTPLAGGYYSEEEAIEALRKNGGQGQAQFDDPNLGNDGRRKVAAPKEKGNTKLTPESRQWKRTDEGLRRDVVSANGKNLGVIFRNDFGYYAGTHSGRGPERIGVFDTIEEAEEALIKNKGANQVQ